MSDQSKQLLRKMAAEYDKNRCTSFEYFFYMSYPEEAIEELAIYGYVERKNNVLGSILLTAAGYLEAKR